MAKRRMRAVLARLAWGLGVTINSLTGLVLLFAALSNWAGKDGLGPDASPSRGVEAWNRWLYAMVTAPTPLYLLALPFVLGALCCWIAARLSSHGESHR